MRHPRRLGEIEHLAADTEPRQEDYSEADNPQTAYPLRQASPEQYAMGHALDIVQYGGASGREA